MIDLLLLVVALAAVLVAAYAPGYAAVRLLGGSPLLALSAAPALGAFIAGSAAIGATAVGVRWSVLPWAAAAVLALIVAGGLRTLGIRLPGTVLDGRLSPRGAVPWAPAWLVLAAAVAVVPIGLQARSPRTVLERWDTLYHLSALQRIRETGDASSLVLGSVSNTAGVPTAYPAGFHALASLVPGVPVPILLNAAVLGLAVLPWALGIAMLARAVFPQVPWAPFAASVVALLIPASPLNLWIHLSPIPNLTASAMLPGWIAAVAALWQVLLARLGSAGPTIQRPRRALGASLLVVGLSGAGLALTHPNVAVTALLLVAVLTLVTGARLWSARPSLALVPVLSLLPIAALIWTPLGSAVTEFSGGLQQPWWVALRELLLGLLTVWPMALSVVLAVLWWPGLVSVLRSDQRWLAVAWAVFGAMYLDAVLDSPLNLSILYYRGQDRLSMPLAMLSAVLVVPGLQAWSRLLRRSLLTGWTARHRRNTITALVLLAVVAAAGSIPARLDYAARNLAPEYGNRGRFLQADELAAWERLAPQLDRNKKVLASPFTGGSHMYAIHGQQVHVPVAGTSLRQRDHLIIQAAADAPNDPRACAFLERWEIGYVYQDSALYQHDADYAPLSADLTGIGPVILSTSHSTLYEVDCDTGDGSTDYTPSR